MDNYREYKYTIDKHGFIRFDYLFSYWIIAWFLIYYFIDVKSEIGQSFRKYGNPKLALIIALIENAITLIWIAIVNGEIWTIFKYLCMILIVKVGPLYLVWGSPIRIPQDIYTFIAVFVIYNVYLYLNDETLITIYHRTFTSIINRDNKTPLFGLAAYLGYLFHIDNKTLSYL